MRVVVLGASWCAQCKTLWTIVDSLRAAGEFPGTAFEYLDVDSDAEGTNLAQRYSVMSLPTVVVTIRGTDHVIKPTRLSLSAVRTIITKLQEG